MDNITRAQLDALEGKRGPPDSLFLLGAGEFRSQLLRPSIERDARMRQMAAAATHRQATTAAMPSPAGKFPPGTVGGGGASLPAWATVQHGVVGNARLENLDSSLSLPDALAVAEQTMAATEPVHVYDLKETADRKTQELIEKEKMILHYKVYTMEDIENSPLERQRARVMEFFYRIADGTLHVYEPKQDNSGLWQGDYAKKHIPFKPDGSGIPYGPHDFVMGAEVWVSGRCFTLVDADARTRELVQERYGITLGGPIHVPESYVAPVGGPVGHHPKPSKLVCDMGDMEDPVHGFYHRAPDTKGKFMEHGSAMLRFECEWRETSEPFGDRRSFALHYYLADDTLEVLDKTSPYSRGGQFTKFVMRQRLPRVALEANMEAAIPKYPNIAQLTSQATVSKVVGMSQQARQVYKYSSGPTVWSKSTSPITGDPVYKPESASQGKSAAMAASIKRGGAVGGPSTVAGFPVLSSLSPTPEFITAADLICGGVICVYGRPMLIKSCDPYTVTFGMQRLGIDQRATFITDTATVASERAAVAPHLVPRGVVPLAPHIGVAALGSEEETRVNAAKIVPTYRAERNFDKFYQLQGKILRFEARMDPSTCDPDDARREFVVSYYLEDETMSIVEVYRDRKGASAVRWLSRGNHRNFRGEPDQKVAAAVLGNRPGIELPVDAQTAYDRVYAGSGDRFGYGDGFGGQGYTGGIYGKADRVGAGGTGVPSRTDVGIRDPSSHSYTAPPRYFSPDDFYVGGTIQLAHAPGQTFMLMRPDGFTKDYLAARDAQQVSDARDVYVADTRLPVPSLPLEAVASYGSGANFEATTGLSAADTSITIALDATHEEKLPLDVHDACLIVAKLLAGVWASCHAVVKQTDKAKRSVAPRDVVIQAFEKYGCRAPACEPGIVELVVNHFVTGTGGTLLAEKQAQENARATKHAPYRPHTPSTTTTTAAAPGGSPLAASRGSNINGMGTVATIENPLHGPHFNDYLGSGFSEALLVDYPRLFLAIKAVADRQQVLQPRLEKIVSQLRMALTSSRTHLRRVFRDLDTTGRGIITFTEFRRMLMRHHLDIGLNDAQIRALLSRFPQADAVACAGIQEPAISWQGFVEVIVDAKTLAPGEMDQFLDFVRGARDDAPDGVGGTRVWPEMYPHVNHVSSWSPDMDLSRFGGGGGAIGGGGGPSGGSGSRPSTGTSRANAAAPPTLPSQFNASMGAGGGSANAAVMHQSYRQPVKAALPIRPATTTQMQGNNMSFASSLAAANGPSHTLAVGGAPDLPSSRPRTAPAGSADPRPAPERAVLDVLEALGNSAAGANVLERMRTVFGTKRVELFRALSLYDTSRKHMLNAQSFVAAIVSAGLRLSTTEAAGLVKEICRLAGGRTGLIPPATDVYIDYDSFIDGLYA